MNKKRIQQINIIISMALILAIGCLSGYAFGYFRATVKKFPEIQFVKDVNPGVATVKLLEVKNGQLIGETIGQRTRIAYNPTETGILELEPKSEFSIPLNQIYLKDFYQARDVPEGAMFVASSQGKYYYSLFDKRAFTISPKNRLYFHSKQEAENRGYLAK
ncbi:MAG: hypothetical protein V1760_02220 [Candidatus Peregrinibacteria bacterium]